MSDLSVSAVIPVYSETDLLVETVSLLRKKLGGDLHQSIIVYHPNASPECIATCERLAASDASIRLLKQGPNSGIGWAYREAIPYITGSHTLIISSDLETDPNDAGLMTAKARETGADIVCASRWLPGGGFEGYSPLKLVLNFTYNWIFRTLYGISIHDITFGYRLMRTEILRNVKWEYGRHQFCAEILLKPVRLGYKAVEIPTRWVRRATGTSQNNLWRDLRFATAALRIRTQSRDSMRAKSEDAAGLTDSRPARPAAGSGPS